MSDDDLTTAYFIGVEDMREIINKQVGEIERLRLELDMAQATILVPSQADDRRTIERLRAENERLRKEAMSDYHEGYEEGYAALKTENERLREALKPFAYYADLIPEGISDMCSASGTVGDLRAARKALGDES